MATNDQLKPEDGKTPLAETFAAGGVEEQGDTWSEPPETPEDAALAEVFFEALAGRDPNPQTADEKSQTVFGSRMRDALQKSAAAQQDVPDDPEATEISWQKLRARMVAENLIPAAAPAPPERK